MDCVVSGANRGLGLELCKQLLANGHHVTALCRMAGDELRALKLDIVEHIELSNDECVPILNAYFANRRVDLLILNAGMAEPEPDIETASIDIVRAQIEVNSIGPMRIIKSIRRSLAPGGCVVFISSRLASFEENPNGGYYGYRMSKAATNMLAKALSADMLKDEICVFAVHPGWMRTRMGGAGAPLAPADSARGIIGLCEGACMERTGKFFLWNGDALKW